MLWVASIDGEARRPDQLRQRVEHVVGGVRIEIAGRLVGQQERGALATARAIATRCCSPPESSAGRCVSRSLEAQIGQQLARALARLAAPTGRGSSAAA